MPRAILKLSSNNLIRVTSNDLFLQFISQKFIIQNRTKVEEEEAKTKRTKRKNKIKILYILAASTNIPTATMLEYVSTLHVIEKSQCGHMSSKC